MAVWAEPCRPLLKKMWLIAQGLFLNHPFYTEVGGFQCDERKNYHFISLSEINEVWWVHFEISVVQIGYSPCSTESLRGDYLHFCWSDASLGETKPEAKGRKSWSQASANTALSYIHAFLDGTWYREQPIYQGLWEHGTLLPCCFGCAPTQLHPIKDGTATAVLLFWKADILFLHMDPGQNRTRSNTLSQCARAVQR